MNTFITWNKTHQSLFSAWKTSSWAWICVCVRVFIHQNNMVWIRSEVKMNNGHVDGAEWNQQAWRYDADTHVWIASLNIFQFLISVGKFNRENWISFSVITHDHMHSPKNTNTIIVQMCVWFTKGLHKHTFITLHNGKTNKKNRKKHVADLFFFSVSGWMSVLLTLKEAIVRNYVLSRSI